MANRTEAGHIPAPEVVARYLYDNPKRAPSLQSQMGLQQDRKTLQDMAAVAHQAALEHLELEKPGFRHEQRPEILSTITKKVLEECEGLDRYEGGWPVSRYIRIFLKNYHPETKKVVSSSAKKVVSSSAKKVVSSSAKKAKVSATGSTRGTARPNRRSLGSGMNSANHAAPDTVTRGAPRLRLARPSRRPPAVKRPTATGPANAPRQAQTDSLSPAPSAPDANDQARRTAARTPPPHGPQAPGPAHAPEAPADADADADADAGAGAVQRFLTQLRIPARDVDQLTALFGKMGVADGEYLALFATLHARDGWLRDLREGGELTGVQAMALREGLDRIKDGVR